MVVLVILFLNLEGLSMFFLLKVEEVTLRMRFWCEKTCYHCNFIFGSIVFLNIFPIILVPLLYLVVYSILVLLSVSVWSFTLVLSMGMSFDVINGDLMIKFFMRIRFMFPIVTLWSNAAWKCGLFLSMMALLLDAA